MVMNLVLSILRGSKLISQHVNENSVEILIRSLVYTRNGIGPRTVLCGTPYLMTLQLLSTFHTSVKYDFVKSRACT